MNVKELRIGNLVIAPETPFEIISASLLTISHYESDLMPIPLTEDWLLRFGFEEDWCFSLGHHETRTNDGENYIYWVDSNYITEIKYVHQLQNLYFALTGKELEIKE